jgi:transcriptional regulator GlxA family with amidase domain
LGFSITLLRAYPRVGNAQCEDIVKQRTDHALFGIVIYDGVEPIDIGGTVGVISMARRVLPAIGSITVAARAGPVQLAGGMTIMADVAFQDCPPCDVFVVCGGPGWEQQIVDPEMLEFLRGMPPRTIASVCTGGLILAAAGTLDGLHATTRRKTAGAEPLAPLERLSGLGRAIRPVAAAIVDHQGVVTSGGVSLAIDGTLYLIGRMYGDQARDEAASLIEYDRAYAANRAALGHTTL